MRKFVSGQAGALVQIKERMANSDVGTAERLAHTLKGTAGTIGAMVIREKAAQIEQSIRQEIPVNQWNALLSETEAELDRMIHALQKALPPEISAALPASDIDWTKVKEVVMKLESLLKENDAEAIDVFEESAPLLTVAFGPEATPIENALKNYRLKDALTALDTAKAAHPMLDKFA